MSVNRGNITDSIEYTTEIISVMTDFGELVASPFAGGISVDINLPDGKNSGQLAFIEAVPEDLRENYPTPVHVFTYNGLHDSPVHQTDVHLDGDAMTLNPVKGTSAETAAWKEKYVPIDRHGDDALVMHKMADGSREFIVAHGYDGETGHWGHGTYYGSLASAAADLEGRYISTGEEVICPDLWYRSDIESALENAGLEVNDANVDATLKELGLDGEWFDSNFHDRLAEMGNEMIADAVGSVV